jgi:hypothetical protein
MIGSSSHNFVHDGSRFGRPFLSTHRAHAACARELVRLTDEVVRGVTALIGATQTEKVTVRRSPDRCIVQLGPVALTVGWLLGNNDAIAQGELLVIVWRGAVAPRKEHRPERPSKGPAPVGAAPLWEQVLAAVGDSEDTWRWHPQGDESGPCSSTELAERCVSRLHAAYLEGLVSAPDGPAAVKVA